MREAALSLYLLLVLAAERVGAGKPPKAYLINLPKHAERYRTVKAQLESAGMRYERIGAVDGKALSTTEMKANVTALARVLLTRGMIGCFLSHRKCWQHCLEEADGPVLGALARTSQPAERLGPDVVLTRLPAVRSLTHSLRGRRRPRR